MSVSTFSPQHGESMADFSRRIQSKIVELHDRPGAPWNADASCLVDLLQLPIDDAGASR